MPKAVQRMLIAVAGVAGLVLVGVAIVVARFDPNDYKPFIIDRVQQDKQRTLAVPGAIRLSVFPRIGVQLGALSLSERASPDTFASVTSAHVSLALLPLLLRRQLVVDKIVVDGLRATLIRRADGSMNIDDLLGANDPAPGAVPATPQQPLAFDVAGVQIGNASITIDDRQTARHLALTGADISTGRLAPGVASDVSVKGHLACDAPRLAVDLGIKGSLLLNPVHRHHALRKLDAEVSGSAAVLSELKARLRGSADIAIEPLRLTLANIDLSLQGKLPQGTLDASVQVPQLELGRKTIAAQKIAARLVLKRGTRTLQATLALSSFTGSAQAFSVAAVDGEMALDDGPLKAKVRLAGRVDGNADQLLFASPLTSIAIDGQHGPTVIKGSVSSPWSANLKTQQINLPRIAASLTLPDPRGGSLALQAGGSASVDLQRNALQSSLAGTLDQSRFNLKLDMPSLVPAAYAVDASVDQIDVDRYRSAGARSEGKAPTAALPLSPVDLSALRGLRASGSVRVGALKVANVKLGNVRVGLHAAAGRLELRPLAADLYRGSVAGGAVLEANATPRLTVQQTLTDIDVGALQHDALGRTWLDGRGTVAVDVVAQGATVDALVQGLNGTARLALKDGMVHGVNIAQAIRNAKARLGLSGGWQAGMGAQSEGTDFSELAGSFTITNGVAHSDDLLAKTPLLRVTGNAAIDLAASRLDCTVSATVVATLQGQGGPELQALRGQTVPVRLKGPFTAIGYSIDLGAMLKNVARQKLGDTLTDLLRR